MMISDCSQCNNGCDNDEVLLYAESDDEFPDNVSTTEEDVSKKAKMLPSNMATHQSTNKTVQVDFNQELATMKKVVQRPQYRFNSRLECLRYKAVFAVNRYERAVRKDIRQGKQHGTRQRQLDQIRHTHTKE